MKKKILVVPGVLILLIIAAFIAITNGLSEGQNVALNGVDLSNISDGDYTGTYEHGRWTNTITVQVKNRVITGIVIVKNVAAAGITNCADEVFRRVMEKQNTQIDVVSGATVTTKAYLKAIENALRK
ncbi:MAG: FMN-binding protein [Treponema sp.]|jgi:uncharacterized protein with FMN-binding domain|nr:FMN-binding protein [Treponema sp.]